jgi:hypothetical protein
MASQPSLIIEIPAGGAVERQLRRAPPPSVAGGGMTIVSLAAGESGRLEPPEAGEVVLSVLSPEALAREPEEVRRVIDRAGPGDEPLIVVVEAAEELRDEELGPVLAAARRSRRTVILRIAGDG